MKAIFIIFLMSLFTVDAPQRHKYYILQYSAIQFDSNIIKYNSKCYQSKFELSIKNMVLEVKTDSVDYFYKIVKHKTHGNGSYTLSKDNIPYLLKEISSKNGEYYLIITPFKFNGKYAYGGDYLAISNKKICN